MRTVEIPASRPSLAETQCHVAKVDLAVCAGHRRGETRVTGGTGVISGRGCCCVAESGSGDSRVPGAGHRATPGGRTRRGAVGLHHRLPRRLGRAAPPGPAAGRRPGRRLRPLLHPTDPPRRLVRGDRRQDHARRGAVIVFRVRADLRQQTQTAAVRRACRPGDAGQPAGHLPHRRRRRHLPACPTTSTRRPSTCWTGSTSRCASPC